MKNKKMTRKRLHKLLMAHGLDRNTARDLIECIIIVRRHDDVLNLTIEFHNGQRWRFENMHSYREIYETTTKDGMPLV